MICIHFISEFENLLLSLILYLLIPFSGSITANVTFETDRDGGFHRTLNFNIEFNDLEEKEYYVVLHFKFPPVFYVNVDELSDLQRKGKVIFCSEGEINVELLAEKAESQKVSICSSLTKTKISLQLPIHQRYLEAKEGGGYIQHRLPKPKLFIGYVDIIGTHILDIEFRTPCFELAQKWQKISYVLNPDEYIWYVPVGDTSMLPVVTWITNIFVALGTLCILWTLHRVNSRNEVKVKNN